MVRQAEGPCPLGCGGVVIYAKVWPAGAAPGSPGFGVAHHRDEEALLRCYRAVHAQLDMAAPAVSLGELLDAPEPDIDEPAEWEPEPPEEPEPDFPPPPDDPPEPDPDDPREHDPR